MTMISGLATTSTVVFAVSVKQILLATAVIVAKPLKDGLQVTTPVAFTEPAIKGLILQVQAVSLSALPIKVVVVSESCHLMLAPPEREKLSISGITVAAIGILSGSSQPVVLL